MQPDFSPWGEIQWSETLFPGMELVSTASHGGVRVSGEAAMLLTPAARKCGFRDGGFLWFEEDSQEAVVLRELLDRKLWQLPERITDKAAFMDSLDRSLRQYNPEYWKARENRLAKQARAEHRPQRHPAR